MQRLVSGLNALIGRNSPGWIPAVVTGPEQADHIAGGIGEASLPPEPMLVRRQLGELESRGKQLPNPRIQVSALEVHDNTSVVDRSLHRVQREGGVAFWALEACVARWRVDDERKAHVAIERDGAIEVCDREGNLVEIHGSLYLWSNAEIKPSREAVSA